MWIVRFTGPYPFFVTVTMAKVSPPLKQDKPSYRGSLLVEIPLENFIGHNPLQTIVLNDYHDIVESALQNTNLLFQTYYEIPGESYEKLDPHVNLYCFNGDPSVDWHWQGTPEDEKGMALWEAIKTTCKTLLGHYGDPELTKALYSGTNPFWRNSTTSL